MVKLFLVVLAACGGYWLCQRYLPQSNGTAFMVMGHPITWIALGCVAVVYIGWRYIK